jgi:hypothetical protein
MSDANLDWSEKAYAVKTEMLPQLKKAADYWEKELEKAATNLGPPKAEGPMALATNMLLEIYRNL